MNFVYSANYTHGRISALRIWGRKNYYVLQKNPESFDIIKNDRVISTIQPPTIEEANRIKEALDRGESFENIFNRIRGERDE